MRRLNEERDREIVTLHAAGKSMAIIARQFQISSCRVQQILTIQPRRDKARTIRLAKEAVANWPRITLRISYPDDDSWMVD